MFKGTEKRVNERWNTITYWRNDVLVGRRCTKCGIDKQINEFNFYNKKESIYHSVCKECEKQYHKERPKKRKLIIVNEKGLIVKVKRGSITYWKDDVMVGRRCTKCGKDKEISEFKFVSKKGKYEARCKECERGYYKENAEHMKKYNKQWREENSKHVKELGKRYYEENKEKIREYNRQKYAENKEKMNERAKQHYKVNKEKIKERDKQKYENGKKENLKNISNLIEEINLNFAKLNLPVYGCIYKFENIKTGHVYIGQTTIPLKKRYKLDVVSGWISERMKIANQKFSEDFNNKEDFIFTEALDIACCQYHLDKLEAHYIDQYDSCNNGYNNKEGNHSTDDGLEEFEQILKNNGLEFIDGKLVKIA